MRGLVFAVLLALVGGVAEAETAVVRTGEHDGFTRIVLYAQSDQKWSVERDGASLVVSSATGARFDLRDAFRRIPRDRVVSLLDRGDGSLSVALNCECDFRQIPWQAHGLILDILDGPYLEETDEQPSVEDAAEPAVQIKLPQFAAVSQKPLLQTTDALAISEIERQISVALNVPFSSTQSDLPFHNLGAGSPSIEDQLSSQFMNSTPRAYCASLSEPEVWGLGSDFVDGLRRLRQAEPGSSGYSSDQAVAFARHYLFYGFASEARSMLENVHQLGAEGRLFLSLAQTLENLDKQSLDNMLDQCGSDALLWRFISDDDVSSYAEPDISMIARHALDLPDALFSLAFGLIVERLQQLSPEAAAVVRSHARALGADQVEPRSGDGHAVIAAVQAVKDDHGALYADVLESLWFEHRGTTDGEIFVRQLANSLLTERAFERLEEIAVDPNVPPALRREIAERTLIVVAAESEDDVFLRTAFRYTPADYSGRVRRLVAERLSLLGFVEGSQKWLGHSVDRPQISPVAVQLPPQAPPPAPELGRVATARKVLSESDQTLTDLRDILKAME